MKKGIHCFSVRVLLGVRAKNMRGMGMKLLPRI